MSSEFSGGYGSIRGQAGANHDSSGSSGRYQSEGRPVFTVLRSKAPWIMLETNDIILVIKLYAPLKITEI